MTKIIIGILIGAGITFSILAIWEKEELKKEKEYEEWRRRLP